jgi:hypothetical protein
VSGFLTTLSVSRLYERRKIGCGGADWIKQAQNKDQWRLLEKDNEISAAIKCGGFLISRATTSFPRRTLLQEVRSASFLVSYFLFV